MHTFYEYEDFILASSISAIGFKSP